MPAYLEVLEGPSAGRRYAPGAAETTVGIVEHCEVALLPPGGNAAAQAVEVAVPFAAPRRRRLSAFGTGLSSGRRRGFHLASARAMLRIHVFDGRQRRIGPARARRPADAVGEEAMMGTRIAAALAVAALLLSAVALGEELAPAPAPGESPGARNPEAPQPGTAEAPGIGASTPQEALEQLQKAAQSGDLRKAASLFAEPFASLLAKTLAATETMAKAAGKLNEAVTSRLGAEAAKALRLERRMKPPTGTPFEGKIEMIDLKEEGDRATAKVKTTKKTGEVHEESIELEKGAGGWKILPPRRGDKTPMTEKDLKQMAALSDGVLASADAYERLAADILTGTVTAVDQVRQRIQEADMEVMKAMMSAVTPPEGAPRPVPGGPGTPPAAPGAPTGTAGPSAQPAPPPPEKGAPQGQAPPGK